MPEDLDQIAPGAAKDEQIAGMGSRRAPPAPAEPGRSCRAAYRCARPPATPAHPREPGSSPLQHVEHTPQGLRHRSRLRPEPGSCRQPRSRSSPQRRRSILGTRHPLPRVTVTGIRRGADRDGRRLGPHDSVCASRRPGSRSRRTAEPPPTPMRPAPTSPPRSPASAPPATTLAPPLVSFVPITDFVDTSRPHNPKDHIRNSAKGTGFGRRSTAEGYAGGVSASLDRGGRSWCDRFEHSFSDFDLEASLVRPRAS